MTRTTQEKLATGGGGGASAFTDLSDAPSRYSDVVLTELFTPNNFYIGDNQKTIAIGADGFVRFVYMDNNDLHYVHCLDDTGSTYTDEIVATSMDGIDSCLLRIGSDGLSRVVYITYANPNEIHFIKFNSSVVEGTNVDDVVVTTSAGGYYELAFALDSNDVPFIVFTDYEDDLLKLAVCSDDAGTLDEVKTITENNGELTVAIQIGSNDAPRIAYFSSDANHPLHFVVCDTSGNVVTDQEMTDQAGSANKYYLDMVLDSSDLPFIAFTALGYGLVLAHATQADGSPYAAVLVDDDTSIHSQSESPIALGSDGFARIVYQKNNELHYARCLTAFGEVSHLATLAPKIGNANTTMILGLDDLARIIYSSDQSVINLVRLTAQSGDSNHAGHLVKVNEDNDGLIFEEAENVPRTLSELDSKAFTELSDVPQNYALKSGKTVTVREDETGLEFTDPLEADGISGNEVQINDPNSLGRLSSTPGFNLPGTKFNRHQVSLPSLFDMGDGEMVTNGDFNGNADGWTLNSCTYGSNNVNFNFFDTLSQDIGAVTGHYYKVYAEITANAIGADDHAVWVKFGNTGALVVPMANGANVLEQVFQAYGDDTIDFYFHDLQGTITNISVIEYTNAAVIIETQDAVNSPTIKIPDASGKFGVLITGDDVPGDTPPDVGVFFLDTTHHKLYVSDGVSSSGDWRILN